MPFKSGASGNPGGRPKGVRNKLQKPTKELISKFCLRNFGDLQFLYEDLTPNQKMRWLHKFAEFIVSKGEDEINLSPEQIELIISSLKKDLNKEAPGVVRSTNQNSL